jgi:transcriptional regulator with XRE-family HTH domain
MQMIYNINKVDKYIDKTEVTTVNIKKAREKAGLTQQELADKLGVGQSAVAMWESQKALPRTDKLPVLAKVLKCSVSALLKK